MQYWCTHISMLLVCMQICVYFWNRLAKLLRAGPMDKFAQAPSGACLVSVSCVVPYTTTAEIFLLAKLCY